MFFNMNELVISEYFPEYHSTHMESICFPAKTVLRTIILSEESQVKTKIILYCLYVESGEKKKQI